MSSLASPSPVARLVAGRRSVASRLPRRAASPLAVRRANTTAADEDDAARPDADDAPGPAGSIVVHLPAPEIVVVGLGPGDPGQITLEAWDVLTAPGARVFARTAQHPTLAGLPRDVAMSTFDHVYERVQNLQDVYPEIVEELVDAARCAAAAAEVLDEDEHEHEHEDDHQEKSSNASDDDTFASYVLPADADEVRVRREPRARRVVYAVPGDPCVAERSVALLRRRCEDAGIALTLVHGVSFLEPTLAAVGADVMPALAIVDAIDVARARGHAVGVGVDAPALLCQLHSAAIASDCKLALMNQYPPEHPVTLVHAAGTSEAYVEVVPLHEMDRSERIGVLTSAFVPEARAADGGDARGTVDALMDAVLGARRDRFEGPGRAPEEGEEGEEAALEWDDEEEGSSFGGDSSSEGVAWFAADPSDEKAAEAIRTAGERCAAAAARAFDDPEATEARVDALADALAHACLHVAIAAEGGEFAMRDVVAKAIERVERETKARAKY